MEHLFSTKCPPSPHAGICKTRVNISEFVFTWEIENFSHCAQRTGEELLSSTFSTEESRDKWCLSVYVRGNGQESKDHMSLYLKLVQSDRETVGATCLFSIKSHKEEKSYNIGDQCQDNYTAGGNGRGWPKFINRSYLLDPMNALLPDDKLTIVCSMFVAGEIITIAGQVPMSGSRLRNSVKPYADHEFGECVTLSVGGQEFNVYKAVLSAHSPVFSAMFEHDTKETRTGHIDIEDTEPEVIKEFLQFLYAGSAPNLVSMADELLVLADKYRVDNLKLICEEAMCEQLSVENACAVLVQADRMSATRLKSYAVQFVIAEAAAVSKSEGFQSLAEHYPQLLIETFQTMTANQSKPSDINVLIKHLS